MKTSFLNSARADYMKALAVLGEADPQDAENFAASVFGALVSFEDNPKAYPEVNGVKIVPVDGFPYLLAIKGMVVVAVFNGQPERR